MRSESSLAPDGGSGSANPDISAAGGSSWLLRSKVIAPELPAGYVRRASLWRHLEGVLERRLTVLRAPAGFGKTTALTDVARDRKERGFLVGWISLDEDDSPNQFGSYLAYAFEHAGLGNVFLGAQDTWSSLPAVQQVGMLARAIETRAEPCLIVLDEVDRLPRPTVHLINLLLRRAPGNLHVAMALRFVPELDLAPYVLDGSAIIVGSHDLRFSRADIARFFDGGLSRRELVAVEERTQGWPAALLVYRNTERRQTGTSGADATQLTENYIGVHVLRDLSEEDRAALLDLAVFDWIETDFAERGAGIERCAGASRGVAVAGRFADACGRRQRGVAPASAGEGLLP